MKNLAKFLNRKLAVLLLPLLLVSAGCTADEPPAAEDADLVVEQFVTENNDVTGLIYAACTIHWEDGQLVTMRFNQRFASAEQAAIAYQGRLAELGESGQVTLDADTVSYYIDVKDWQGKTYSDMYDLMSRDKSWQIVEEKSGSYQAEDSM